MMIKSILDDMLFLNPPFVKVLSSSSFSFIPVHMIGVYRRYVDRVRNNERNQGSATTIKKTSFRVKVVPATSSPVEPLTLKERLF